MTTYILAKTNEQKIAEIQRHQKVLEHEILALDQLVLRLRETTDVSADFQFDPELADWDLQCATEDCKSSPVPEGSINYLSNLPIGGNAPLCRICRMSVAERLKLQMEQDERAVKSEVDTIRRIINKRGSAAFESMIEEAKDPSKDFMKVLLEKIEAKNKD